MKRFDAIALVLLTAAAIVPFWSGQLLLATDLPQHLAQAAIARDFPGRGLDAFYAVDLSPRPYLGATYVLMLLGADQLAARTALTIYAIALVLAVRALIAAAPGRDPRLIFLAPLFVSSWPLAYGFLPFVFGLPPALCAIAWARERSLFAVFVALLLALLFHPLAFAIGVVGMAPFLRARPRLLAAVGLAALLLVFPAPSPELVTDEHIHTAWRFQIKHKLLAYAFAYLPGNLDLYAVLPASVVLVCAFIVRRRAGFDAYDVCGILLAAVYLASPADLSISGHKISLLGPRLLIAAWIGALLCTRSLPRFFAPGAALSVVAMSTLLAITAHNYGEQWGPRVQAAIAQLPENAVLAPKFAGASSVFHTKLIAPPEQHLHAYAMLKRASYDAALFSTKQSSVQLKARPNVTLEWIQTTTISVR